MIIITLKPGKCDYVFHNEHKIRIYYQYITSIEYIDNGYDDILVKRTYNGESIQYRNKNDLLHNPDGPALIFSNKECLYYLNGVRQPKPK